MADLARIKSNVRKMAAQGAPEKDIDGYIASEGVTLDDVRSFTEAPINPRERAAQVSALPADQREMPSEAAMRSPEENLMGTGEDVARSAATGVRSGAEFLAGGGGDVRDLAAAGSRAIIGDENTKALGGFIKANVPGGNLIANLPNTQDVHAATTGVVGESYKPQTTAGEYARTVGEFLPAAVAGPGGIVRRVATQAIAPAVLSETAGQMTEGTAAEPYARVAGALLAPVGGAGLRRLATPFPASAERLAQADVLAAEGVDLTAGQRTGSEKLRYMESELGGTAGQRFNERQGEQFTSATLRRAGINAPRATPEVIDAAFDRIGGDFDNLAARNTLVPDAPLARDLTATLHEYNSLVPDSQRAPVVREIINDIVQNIIGGGRLSGEQYQAYRSRLDRMARASAADPQLSMALRDIRTTLDEGMERSIAAHNPADAGEWRRARREYRNMMVIEKAATTATGAEGLIVPSALRNANIQVNKRRAYARGQGDFAELARAGDAVMKPLPNSGTASRMNARGLGSALAGSIAGSAIPGVGSIMGAAAGAIAPAALGRAMLSRPGRAILGNQALQPLPLPTVTRQAFLSGLMGGRHDSSQGGRQGPLEITVRKPVNSLTGNPRH